MPFVQSGTIKYYQFSTFKNLGVNHAVFTRHGGCSKSPWQSLNFGASVGDDPECVKQNRLKALDSIGVKPESVYDVYQVHSSDIVVVDTPLQPGEAHIKADAMVTNKIGLTLMMRFADCVPIFLLDPAQRAIGIVHAGWIGTVNKVAAKTIRMMVDTYATKPQNIVAAIGPSIGAHHYPVGSEVVEKVKLSFRDKTCRLLSFKDGKTYFDLWKANQLALNEAGVCQVEISGICTSCHLEDWFSHRGELGKTGRFGAVLGLV